MTQNTSDNSLKIIFHINCVRNLGHYKNAGIIPIEQNVRVVNIVDTQANCGHIEVSKCRN